MVSSSLLVMVFAGPGFPKIYPYPYPEKKQPAPDMLRSGPFMSFSLGMPKSGIWVKKLYYLRSCGLQCQ
jgi:hypothetical protein